MAGEAVYKAITDQIIKLLERGEVPWRKPWVYASHYNLKSKKSYNGINLMVLDCVASLEGYQSNIWCTFKQANAKGGKIRKGEQHTKVVWWRFIYEENDEENGKVKFAYPMYYKVWNAEQIDWEDDSVLDGIIPENPNDNTEVDPDEVLFDYMDEIEIKHGGGRAFYAPSKDYIQLPAPEQFESDDEYYSTLYHELIHSTGHWERLHRFDEDVSDRRFGSENYSFEELVAEFGSAFMCARTDIDDVRVIENSAAYIAGWKSKLSENTTWITKAASKARIATEYILGTQETVEN